MIPSFSMRSALLAIIVMTATMGCSVRRTVEKPDNILQDRQIELTSKSGYTYTLEKWLIDTSNVYIGYGTRTSPAQAADVNPTVAYYSLPADSVARITVIDDRYIQAAKTAAMVIGIATCVYLFASLWSHL